MSGPRPSPIGGGNHGCPGPRMVRNKADSRRPLPAPRCEVRPKESKWEPFFFAPPPVNQTRHGVENSQGPFCWPALWSLRASSAKAETGPQCSFAAGWQKGPGPLGGPAADHPAGRSLQVIPLIGPTRKGLPLAERVCGSPLPSGIFIAQPKSAVVAHCATSCVNGLPPGDVRRGLKILLLWFFARRRFFFCELCVMARGSPPPAVYPGCWFGTGPLSPPHPAGLGWAPPPLARFSVGPPPTRNPNPAGLNPLA